MAGVADERVVARHLDDVGAADAVAAAVADVAHGHLVGRAREHGGDDGRAHAEVGHRPQRAVEDATVGQAQAGDDVVLFFGKVGIGWKWPRAVVADDDREKI